MNSQLQVKLDEAVKLQNDNKKLIQSSSQLKATTEKLKAQNEKLIQEHKVKFIMPLWPYLVVLLYNYATANLPVVVFYKGR